MENGPVLKKVRRPINRALPVSDAEPSVHNDVENKSDVSYNQDTPVNTEPVSAPFGNIPAPKINLPSVERDVAQPREERYDYEEPQYSDDEYYNNYAPANNNGVSVKVLIVAILCCLAAGLFMGRFLFGETQVTHNGLQGVVVNSEVPRGRARCGVADRSQGCVMYIMNPQRQNVRAKDFYDMAAQVTGRQRFMIETGNMRYANTEIKPGDIAQLNIPPL